MGYASTSDFSARYDKKLTGDLLSNDGTTQTVTNHVILAELLDEASGMVEAACLAGERYTVTDLEGLTDNSLATLKGLVCGLAFWLLLQRRGHPISKYPAVEMHVTMLDQLRNGARIFNIARVADAGHGEAKKSNRQDIINLRLARDTNQYFPTRRWPI